MAPSCLFLAFLVYIYLVSCNPVPFSFGGGSHKKTQGATIPASELYKSLDLQDVPMTVEGIIISKTNNHTRYGYEFGRPVTRILGIPMPKKLKTVLFRWMSDVPEILHWGVVISDESPLNSKGKVPR